MSRIGIFSDIHGNYPALRAVMEALKRHRCEALICLGDICGYYPFVNECIDYLRQSDTICLKGNHDSYLLGESSCPRSTTVNECIAYQQKVITPDNLEWLATLSPQHQADNLLAVHGGLNDPLDEYVTSFDFDRAAREHPSIKVFLSGHTHIPLLQSKGDLLYCNPGSVGQPRDYDPRAAYAVMEDGRIELHRTTYPIAATAEAMAQAGFTDYYYRNLFHGCRIGER